MHIDTFNILIGASIALVSSVLMAIITYLFQSRSEKQKRQWDIDDHLRDKKFEIEKERLQQAEEWAQGVVGNILATKSRLVSLAGKLSTSDEFAEWARKEIEIPAEHLYKRGVLYRVGNDGLIEIGKELDKHWVELFDLLQTETSGDEQFDTFALTHLFNRVGGDALMTYGKFLKQIDTIKAERLS